MIKVHLFLTRRRKAGSRKRTSRQFASDLLRAVSANNPSIFKIMRTLMSDERCVVVGTAAVMGASVRTTLAAQTHDRR